MKRSIGLALIIPVVLSTLACNALNRTVSTATPPASAVPTRAPTQPPTVAPTSTVVPSSTPAPTATTAPSPAPTDTAEVTLAPTQPVSAFPTVDPTTRALMGPMADLFNIDQYFNPVGTPLTSWNGVPVMPQATTGQSYSADVYSFKADATIPDAVKFYAAPAKALGILSGPATGSAGTGSQATHDAVYLSLSAAIAIYSYDSDPKQIMVVIDKPPS